MLTGSFNRVARDLGVRPFPSFLDLFEGECTLLSDVPEMTGITRKYVIPLIEYFDRCGYLTVVDGTQSIDVVSEKILTSLSEVPSTRPSGC